MGKCNCTPLVIENHAVHKINCSTMTAQPDNTIDSEVGRILKHYKEYVTGVYQGVADYDEATAAHTLTDLIAQEANKAQADILIWATGGIKEFTEDGKTAIPAKIKELLSLTADKEQA